MSTYNPNEDLQETPIAPAWKLETYCRDDGSFTNYDDEHYTDYEFTNGDPCKLFILTYVKENNHWYGVIMASETPEGEFSQESHMSVEMVETLRRLIPVSGRVRS